MNSDALEQVLLKKYGINPLEKEAFFSPAYALGNPYLMHDLERAVVRLYEAITSGEKIVIYSDYDCDGIPGAVILSDLLKKINYTNYEVYIPDRHDEGYGLHKDAVDTFIKNGVTLLVTIDLGITAVDEIAHAQVEGIDVIVTDHHLPRKSLDEGGIASNVLPRAFALVNPKVGGTYPDDMLCGSGVIFTFVRGFLGKYREYFQIPEGWEKWSLDMVGLATLADMVPLVKENRTLAIYGLMVLAKTKRPGLRELFALAKIDERHLSEEDITFSIAPRLNAASRMGTPRDAFLLLSETDPAKAKTYALHLSKINDDRKFEVARIMKETKQALKKRELTSVIVIGNPSWRPGVLGLVASKIVEEYKKPAFVWGGEGEMLKGSCRSDGHANVVSLMSQATAHLVSYGGHEGAGGFVTSHTGIHGLEETLALHYDAVPLVSVEEDTVADQDVILFSPDNITRDVYACLNQFAPFGVGNPKPLFELRDVTIESARLFGKTKEHLEIQISRRSGYPLKAILFFAPEHYKSLTAGTYTIRGYLETSYFMGKKEERIRLTEIVPMV